MIDEITRTEALLELAKRFHLSELEWQEDGLRVVIRREEALAETAVVVAEPRVEQGTSAIADSPTALLELRAPTTGVFYRAPSPDVPALVEVGDSVEAGQIVCLIEAMKVFNEVPAEHSGRVVEICATNGQLVERGAVLFRLEPEEASA